MEKIVMIVFANYWVLLSPCLSYMLYDFFQEGMIFEKYGKWLETINPTIAKPLGNCLKCFHVWIFFFVSLLSGIFFIKYILLLALSYVILIKLFF